MSSLVALHGNGTVVIPVGPVLAIVDAWLHRHGHEGWHESRMGQRRNGTVEPLSPLQQLAARCGMRDVGRALYRMRHEQQYVSLRLADLLVSATAGPHAWFTDPVLRQVSDELGLNRDGAWRDDEEEEPAEAWAARVWAGFTEPERRAVRSIIPVLDDLGVNQDAEVAEDA